MFRLMKKKQRLDSVEAYACVCMSATCSCGCRACNCGCESWVDPKQQSHEQTLQRIVNNFYVSSDHRHGLSDNMRL